MLGQKQGECGHIMADTDRHSCCVRCRDCELVTNPCTVCKDMTEQERVSVLVARSWRISRQQRRHKQRSICSSERATNTFFCFSHGRPSSSGCGRHVNHMEGNVCICVPPICNARASDRQDLTRSSVRADPDRSQMAQSVLVRQTIGASDRLSFGPAPQERSFEPTTQPPATSITSGSVPTRLETVQRSLQEKGFSRAAAEQISREHRQSS